MVVGEEEEEEAGKWWCGQDRAGRVEQGGKGGQSKAEQSGGYNNMKFVARRVLTKRDRRFDYPHGGPWRDRKNKKNRATVVKIGFCKRGVGVFFTRARQRFVKREGHTTVD